jgi:hypothetical protein
MFGLSECLYLNDRAEPALLKTKKGLTPLSIGFELKFTNAEFRDYSRRFLQTGLSPANAFSVN